MTPVNTLSAADRRVWLVIGAMVVIGALALPIGQQAFGLRLTYTVRVVAIGGSILGRDQRHSWAVLPCCGRRACWAMRLSHAALPGVAIAFLLAGRELSLAAGSALAHRQLDRLALLVR